MTLLWLLIVLIDGGNPTVVKRYESEIRCKVVAALVQEQSPRVVAFCAYDLDGADKSET